MLEDLGDLADLAVLLVLVALLALLGLVVLAGLLVLVDPGAPDLLVGLEFPGYLARPVALLVREVLEYLDYL